MNPFDPKSVETNRQFARTMMSISRANALEVFCEYCKAKVGEECHNPVTGYVLVHQPAHIRRLQDAQVV